MNFLKFTILGFLFCFAKEPVYSQSTSEWIWRPEYTHVGALSDDLIYFGKLSLYNSVDRVDRRSNILNVQPQLLLAYRIRPRIRIGAGTVYRWSSLDENRSYYEFRTSQEVGSLQYFAMRRLAHRLRLEQRFRSTTYLNRIRYRIRYNFSLEGELLNPGDHYLILSNEFLTVFNRQDTDAENRFGTGMGWFYHQNRRFELTLEYRTRELFHSDGLAHQFMLKTALFSRR